MSRNQYFGNMTVPIEVKHDVKVSVFAIRYSTTFITLRNHEETLKPSSLPSKQLLVS